MLTISAVHQHGFEVLFLSKEMAIVPWSLAKQSKIRLASGAVIRSEGKHKDLESLLRVTLREEGRN